MKTSMQNNDQQTLKPQSVILVSGQDSQKMVAPSIPTPQKTQADSKTSIGAISEDDILAAINLIDNSHNLEINSILQKKIVEINKVQAKIEAEAAEAQKVQTEKQLELERSPEKYITNKFDIAIKFKAPVDQIGVDTVRAAYAAVEEGRQAATKRYLEAKEIGSQNQLSVSGADQPQDLGAAAPDQDIQNIPAASSNQNQVVISSKVTVSTTQQTPPEVGMLQKLLACCFTSYKYGMLSVEDLAIERAKNIEYGLKQKFPTLGVTRQDAQLVVTNLFNNSLHNINLGQGQTDINTTQALKQMFGTQSNLVQDQGKNIANLLQPAVSPYDQDPIDAKISGADGLDAADKIDQVAAQ